MNKLLPCLLAFAGIIAGLAVGYIASSSREAPRAANALPAPAPAQPAPRRHPSATEPRDAPPVLEGTITGSVSTGAPDVAPVPDVEIFAVPLLEEPAGVETIAAYVERRRALERVTRSDREGRFTLSGLDPARVYAIEPARDGLAFQLEGAQVEYFPVGSNLSFVATVTAQLTLRVTLPDGSPPAAAHVRLEADAGHSPRQWYWTPAQATEPVPAGQWRLQVSAGPRGEYKSETITLALSAGGTESLDVPLRGVPGIHGRVVPAIGVEDAMELQIFHEVDGRFEPGPSHRLWARQAWRFQFNDLSPGRHRLSLWFGNHEVERRDVTIVDDIVRLEFVMPEPDVNDYVVVSVSGPDGPISQGLNLSLSVIGEQPVRDRRIERPLNRGNGDYWLRRREADFSGSGGSYRIFVESMIYGQRNVEYGRHDRHPVAIVFEEATYLNVEIVGLAEHEHREHLHVAIYRPGRRAQRGSSTGVRRDDPPFGPRRFGPLEPGEYVVELFAQDGSRGAELVLTTLQTNVTPGENRIRLHPPELYAFVVVVPEEFSERASMSVNRVGDSFSISLGASSEAAELEARLVPAGEYRVIRHGVGEMRVSLPADAGRRVLFQPLLYNAFRLVLQPDRARVDIGLRDGDYLVAIDGNSLERFAMRQVYLGQAMRSEITTWTIQRGGKRLEVTFKIEDWRQSGVRYEAARAP